MNGINRLRSWHVVLLALTYGVMQVVVLRSLGPARDLLFQLQLTFSEEDFRRIIASLSSEQLAGLKAHFFWDTILPFTYSLAMAANLLLFAKTRPHWFRYLAVFPLVAGLCDLIENQFYKAIVTNPADFDRMAFVYGNLAATAKWCLVTMTVVLLLFCAATRNHASSSANIR